MFADSLLILAVLSLNVALSEWLARHTWLRHLGAALLVIVLTALVANVGLIPPYSGEQPVYDRILGDLAPLAIFWLLLRVHLRSVLRAGLPMIALFVVGALGTVLGVLAGMQAVGGAAAFGELHHALGGMFVATYVGGSVNFTAIAVEYEVMKDGVLFTGAAAVDSAATTVWMAATVALPRLLGPVWPKVRRAKATTAAGPPEASVEHDRDTVDPFGLAVLCGLGFLCHGLSGVAGERLEAASGLQLPPILILTTLALLLAQLPAVQRLRGTKVLGWLAVMYFLAAIGALCDVSSVGRLGDLGLRLMLFVTVLIIVHGVVLFGFAALARLDAGMAAVASQANIGGSTSALALARSLGRNELVLPGVLVGALGNALGTYLGFIVAGGLAG